MKHKTIHNFKIDIDKYPFNYQKALTDKLDKLDGNFNQSIINEIVLWKVSRYAKLDSETLALLNKIKKSTRKVNVSLTRKILNKLLTTKGIRLPMASTILRFKNPNLYQIIDQRVFRLLNKNRLKIPTDIEIQIDLYLDYLSQLKQICQKKEIPFNKSDRILFEIDKEINSENKLLNY